MNRLLVVVASAAALVASLLVSPPATADVPASAGIVQAADLSRFSAGNIISDAVFFDKGTMTEAQIQAFLEAKVPTCRSGYTCLKDWYDTSRTTTTDAMCGAYSGGVRERASRIIYKVAQACGINPQVLLVMLQKEQGLVTHVWPSDWRYTIAMGQGCPDTAACDTRYYGFFNQVFGAAWQMKRYANPPGTSQFFTWYAPGSTWSIRYNPNAACGSSPVGVVNQATANLYYYTPYQPNAAALRAGYGEGDGCSAYGNRNFFNYFTDWFGSTQTPARGALVQSGEPVYFVADGVRRHVSAADYAEFTKVFGATARVGDDVIAGYQDGGAASLFVRNTSNGEVSMLQDGTRHHFATCAQVALWGSRCEDAMALSAAVAGAIGAGPAMTAYARLAGSSRLHLLEDGRIIPLYDQSTAAAANGGSIPYAATLGATVVATREITPVRFPAGRLLTVSGSPQVYLPTPEGRLLSVSSWARAAEFGLPTSVTWTGVPAADVAGYAEGALTDFATCGTSTVFAASGVMYRVSAAAATGFDPTPLGTSTCALLKTSPAASLSTVYVKSAGRPEVYELRDGVYRHVVSAAVLTGSNGGTWPTILTVSAATIADAPKGDPVSWATFPAGSFVKTATDARVYLATQDGRLLHLPQWSFADELGLRRDAVKVVASLEGYRADGGLSLFVSCGEARFFAAGGRIHEVSQAAASGFAVSSLDDATCATLTRAAGATLPKVFVTSTSGPEIYAADAGLFRHVSSMDVLIRLGGGSVPPVLGLLAVTVSGLPKGPAIS